MEGEAGPSIKKIYPIRPFHIREALEWLCVNNKHYMNGKIIKNYNNLDWSNLNTNFIKIEQSKKIPACIQRNKYNENSTEPFSVQEVLLEDKESIDYIKNISNDIINKEEKIIIEFIKSREYIQTYEDPYFFEKSFIRLFPYGVMSMNTIIYFSY